MDLDIKLSDVSYEELLELHNIIKDFISYLDNQIETSEVEKK